MKRFLALFIIFITLAASSVACANPAANTTGNLSHDDYLNAYFTLEKNYESLVNAYESKSQNKITTFDWNFFTASIESGSKRMIKMLEPSDSPIAPLLIDVANETQSMLDEYNAAIKNGTTPHVEQYRQQIDDQLSQAKSLLLQDSQN